MILLIRHCTPHINYNRCSYKEALRRLYQYDTTSSIEVTEILDIKDKIQNIVNLNNIKVFCSTLPRASITAKHLFPKGTDIIASNKFVEFDLFIFYIPFLKCSMQVWFFISRMLWFIGILKTNRNFKQEHKRAKNCARLLATEAKISHVALVAHGVLNSSIEKCLNKEGWKRVNSYSSGCFSIKVLQYV